jgi:hypothetical protein
MSLVDTLAQALLYEGYILYPYRANAVKNRQRFTFGSLYPPAYSRAHDGTDPFAMQTECLVVASGPTATLDVRGRFLHPLSRTIGRFERPWDQLPMGADPPCQFVESLDVDGLIYQAWQEVVEREIELPGIDLCQVAAGARIEAFSFPASCRRELLRTATGEIVGLVLRRQEAIAGTVEVRAEAIGRALFRIRVRIENQTSFDDAASADRDVALLRTMASTHTILNVRDGEFVSLLEPPEELRGAAEDCRNIGAWPVLVGEAGQHDTILSSPIILYDYPTIASESAGDLCDGTEIDEILSLRIMTLSDEEKQQMRSVDERASEILRRTEQMPQEQLLKMHGVLRGLRPPSEITP